MSQANISVLGGDLRQSYLARYLADLGHTVTCLATPNLPHLSNAGLLQAYSAANAVTNAGMVLCPIPFSRDGQFLTASEDPAVPIRELVEILHPGQLLAGGNLPESILEICGNRQITPLDFLKNERFLLENAALTAEGLLAVLIRDTPFSLKGRRALLLGYGRCGQETAFLLSGLSVNLTILEADKDRHQKAVNEHFNTIASNELSHYAMDFDLLINTIPAQILTPSQLAGLPGHCRLFDIASAPFGFCQKTVLSLGLSLVRCPGIPGQWMPQTAGELMGKIILERM